MKSIILQDSCQNPIHIYVYEPKSKPKGIIHIIHGASEHFARYGLFAEFLNQNGFVVIGCDLLGHGLSTDNYKFVHFADKNGDQLVLEGIRLVESVILKDYPTLPRYILGHSMGSFLARKTIIDRPEFYQKAVISGTTIVSSGLKKVGLLLTSVIAKVKGPKYVSDLISSLSTDANPAKMKKDGLIGDFKEAWLTKDENIQNYYHNSEMCGQPFSVKANQDMIRWTQFVDDPKNIAKGNLKMPIYLMSGELDPLSNYGKQVVVLYNLMKKIGYQSISYKLYPTDRHEVLNELDKQTAYQDILKFLTK